MDIYLLTGSGREVWGMQATSEAGERQAGRGGGGPPDMVRAVALVTGVTGLVHLAAAVAHRDHTTLLGMFLVAAALQVLGAVALVSRPRVPALLVLTAVVNGAFVAFYALTRITGLSDIEGLEQAQPVAYGDLAATLLEGVAVLGALAMLAPAALPFAQRPRLARSAPVALVTVALVLGGPAVVASAEHEGSHGGHQHGDAHAHGAGRHAGGHGRDHHRDDHDDGDHDLAAGHRHGDDEAPGHDDHGGGGHGAGDGHHDGGGRGVGGGHDHGSRAGSGRGGGSHDPGGHDPGGHDPGGHDPGGHDPGGDDPGGDDPGGDDPGGDDPGGDDPGGHDPGGHDPGGGDPGFPPDWSPEQIAEAEALIAATEAALPAFDDAAALEAMGFTPFGDLAPGGYTHWTNWEWIEDEHILDPEHPESLVFRSTPSGQRLEAAMFVLPERYDMSSIPDDVAWLPGWHDHDNLCADENRQFTGLAFEGQCFSGTLLEVPPMMHVWIVDTPCGRFAGVDELGLSCGHEH
jgi:hypothetical protein